MLDLRITGQFPDHAAISGSDDQHAFYVWMHCHGNMGDHFMIDELVFFRHHKISVKDKNPAKFRRFKDINPLEFTLRGIKMSIHPYGEFHIGGMRLGKP